MSVWVAFLLFILPPLPAQPTPPSQEDLRNQAWLTYLKGPLVRTCHARVQQKDDLPLTAETLPDLEKRTGVPSWVLIPLNLGYDLYSLDEDDLFVVPFPSRECVDPERVRSVPTIK